MSRENRRTDRPIPSCGLHLEGSDIEVGDEIEVSHEGGHKWMKVGRVTHYGIRPSRPWTVWIPDYGNMHLRPGARVWAWPHDAPPSPRSVSTGNHDRHDQALAAHRAALQQERAAQAAEEERLQNSAEVMADKRAIKVGVEAWAESMGFDDVSIEPQWNKYAKASGAPPCTATVRVQSGDDTWSFGAGLMNDGSVYVGMAGVEVCDDASLGAALERKAYADWKSNW